MGYYSDVALALTSEGEAELQKVLQSVPVAVRSVFGGSMFREVDPRDGFVLYYWESIKWYGHECEQLDALIGDLEPEHYSFVRVGEDAGDFEVHGHLADTPFDLRVATTLQFDHATAYTGPSVPCVLPEISTKMELKS